MRAIKSRDINFLKITRKRKSFVVLSILVVLATCIEPFDPDIDKYDSAMVIIGELIESDSLQKVQVSKSSDYNERKLQPIVGCAVYVEDDKGNTFNYTETDEGIYTCHIAPQYFEIGTSYRLVVNTDDGTVYTSEYDKMEKCPDIDTVYYSVEQEFLGVEDQEVMGVQFYVNLKREQDEARYCRWSLTETWLYKAYYETNAKVDNGEIIRFRDPVYVPTCWLTKRITSVHTAQIEEQIKPVELNYVSTNTPRLYYKYSMLVKQYGISEGAYAFWSALGSQFEEAGELYEKQPQSIKSNIKNANNEDELVLGYFNTASVKQTRIFTKRDWNLRVNDYCEYELLPADSEDWPPIAYLYIEEMVPDIIMSPDSGCFDCRARGGTDVKPDFWED